MTYVIDACALINACHNYSMTSQFFSRVWEIFDDMISKGELISSSEVLDELRDEKLSVWARQHRECFIPLDKPIQDKTKEILKRYPTLIQMKSVRNSNADPFLIATAVLNKGTLVTDERFGDEGQGQIKIPNVCRNENIPCINLQEFIALILP